MFPCYNSACGLGPLCHLIDFALYFRLSVAIYVFSYIIFFENVVVLDFITFCFLQSY